MSFKNCTENRVFQSEKSDVFKILIELYTEMCPSITGGLQSSRCLGPNCMHAHNVNELRRKLFDDKGRLIYTNFPCSSQYNSYETFGPNEQYCGNGDYCIYAHTENEILYHP